MTEAFDENASPQRPMPVLTVLACSGLLLLAAVLAPQFTAAQPLPMLLLLGASLGLLLWVAGFALSIRRASIAWKLGSLALLVAIGTGGGVGAWILYKVQARSDATSFAELEFAPDGTPMFPRGAVARGPMSRLFAETVKADAEDRRGFDAEFARVGVAALTSPYLLEQSPGVLGKCDDVAALKTSAAALRDRRETRIAAVAQSIEGADLSASLKQSMRVMAGADASGQPDPVFAQQVALLEATGDLCRLLAKRSWFNDNARFGFRSAADQAAFRSITGRQQDAVAEAARLEKAAREVRVAAQGKVQDELTRRVLETL